MQACTTVAERERENITPEHCIPRSKQICNHKLYVQLKNREKLYELNKIMKANGRIH